MNSENQSFADLLPEINEELERIENFRHFRSAGTGAFAGYLRRYKERYEL